MTKRIGPRMADVVSYVETHPGCSALAAAEYVGPNRSRRYGYRTVHRAMSAGIVDYERKSGRIYLYPASKGE